MFTERAKYLGERKTIGNLLQNLLGGHGAHRIDQGYTVQYHPPGGRLYEHRIDSGFPEITNKDRLDSLCATDGKSIGDLTLVGGLGYFSADQLVKPPEPPEADRLSFYEGLAQRQKYGMEIQDVMLRRSGDRIVFESAMIRKEPSCDSGDYAILSACPIVAVHQHVSVDGGKTWKKPVMTTHAEIYEVGKPLRDQCFIARPKSFNGKKYHPTFPACRNTEVR
jgi:hypothetical protein